MVLQGDEQFRRDQPLLHEQLSEQHQDLREVRVKSLKEMEELKRVQESRVDESSRRRLIESQDTIDELYAVDQVSHVPSQPALLHLFVVLAGC